MVKAGNMMWNDIVNANCARANTTASQPSNMTSIRRLLQMEPYHTRPADGIAATANREIVRLIISPGTVPVSRRGPQMRNDPAGDHRVVCSWTSENAGRVFDA